MVVQTAPSLSPAVELAAACIPEWNEIASSALFYLGITFGFLGIFSSFKALFNQIHASTLFSFGFGFSSARTCTRAIGSFLSTQVHYQVGRNQVDQCSPPWGYSGFRTRASSHGQLHQSCCWELIDDRFFSLTPNDRFPFSLHSFSFKPFARLADDKEKQHPPPNQRRSKCCPFELIDDQYLELVFREFGIQAPIR